MVKVTKLNKYFNKKKNNEIHVINDVSFEFPQTGLISIVGESGSGKTTLMNVLGGLDDFESGVITIDNTDITKYNSKKIDRIRNEKIGYIFQNYLLLPQRTVYENLEIVLNMYDLSNEEKIERMNYVLKAVGMFKYRKKNISQLSGGQQHRVAIARALIKSPSLILADEPTGNLDEKNTIQIMNIIKKISKNTLVILVSHERRIAESYSDFIIEVSDGKIQKERALFNNTTYQYEDNQNIYLKEYEYKKLSSEEVNIDFYSNHNIPINLKIIYHKGRYHIESDQDIVIVDNNSEVKILDQEREVLDIAEETEEINYELSPIKFVKTPNLSLKEKIKLSFSYLRTMKARTLFLAIPLLVISLLCMFSVQNIITASYIDVKHIVSSDSRVYTINVEKQAVEINRDVMQFGFEHMYKDLKETLPYIEPVLEINTSFKFFLPSFTQLKDVKFEIKGSSLLTTEQLDHSSIIYGRSPENVLEIVVEKWIIERAIENSPVKNFMDLETFIGQEVNVKDSKYNFTIVGIAENNENSVYFNKWALFDLFPSDMRKNGFMLCSISEARKISSKYDSYELKENEAILIDSLNLFDKTEAQLNSDTRLKFKIVDHFYDNNMPYNFIVSDEAYDKVLLSLLSTNYSTFSIYCENETEVAAVENYLNSIKYYYLSGELQATKENGFLGIADFKSVIISFTLTSKYNKILQPHLDEANKVVNSRIVITATILLVACIIVYFTMKSFAVKNIYDIGVLRALGIKKGSIVFVYAFEVLIISLYTTFAGGTLFYIINNVLASIPILDGFVKMHFLTYFSVTFGLMALNIIIGIIPIILCLRLTPSKILSKYDV